MVKMSTNPTPIRFELEHHSEEIVAQQLMGQREHNTTV